MQRGEKSLPLLPLLFSFFFLSLLSPPLFPSFLFPFLKRETRSRSVTCTVCQALPSPFPSFPPPLFSFLSFCSKSRNCRCKVSVAPARLCVLFFSLLLFPVWESAKLLPYSTGASFQIGSCAPIRIFHPPVFLFSFSLRRVGMSARSAVATRSNTGLLFLSPFPSLPPFPFLSFFQVETDAREYANV